MTFFYCLRKNAELERNINIVKKKYVQVLVQSLPISKCFVMCVVVWCW